MPSFKGRLLPPLLYLLLLPLLTLRFILLLIKPPNSLMFSIYCLPALSFSPYHSLSPFPSPTLRFYNLSSTVAKERGYLSLHVVGIRSILRK